MVAVMMTVSEKAQIIVMTAMTMILPSTKDSLKCISYLASKDL